MGCADEGGRGGDKMRRSRERRAREEKEEVEREAKIEVGVLWEGWWALERGIMT